MRASLQDKSSFLSCTCQICSDFFSSDVEIGGRGASSSCHFFSLNKDFWTLFFSGKMSWKQGRTEIVVTFSLTHLENNKK